MRTMLLSLAGAVSALAVASPAAAQWAPQPYGYGSPGYGYNGMATVPLQQRISNIRRQIFVLTREQRLSPEQSRRLFNETRQLDARVRRASYTGMNPYEISMLQSRVDRLEQRVQYAASYGNRYGYGTYGNSYGYNNYNGYNGYYPQGDREDRWGDRDDDGD